jgi:glycolate oxidase FAD binding subunit
MNFMSTAASINGRFDSIVGAANVRAATANDAVAGQQTGYVVSPDSEQELATVLASANEAGIAVIPRGGGTKLDWGNPPKRAGIVLSTARLNRIFEHAWADLTVSVEAGCTMQTLQNTVAQHGQRLALDVLWPERATVGGVLSVNDSGVFRLRFGALRDLIIGVTLALPDGTLASSGGKVVKNVAGYDLPKLATGAFGTLGVITRAVFRLHPLPWAAWTVTCAIERISEAQRLLLQFLDSNLAYSALQMRFAAAREPNISIDLLFEGTEAGIAAQITRVQAIAGPQSVVDADHSVWRARQELHSDAAGNAANTALAKVSTQPAHALTAIGTLVSISATRAKFDAVIQATGLGAVLLRGEAAQIGSILSAFRAALERAGGSMVVLQQPAEIEPLDAWGNPGDAIGVMRALKQQLDPKSTLNPGRFLGGI